MLSVLSCGREKHFFVFSAREHFLRFYPPVVNTSAFSRQPYRWGNIWCLLNTPQAGWDLNPGSSPTSLTVVPTDVKNKKKDTTGKQQISSSVLVPRTLGLSQSVPAALQHSPTDCCTCLRPLYQWHRHQLLMASSKCLRDIPPSHQSGKTGDCCKWQLCHFENDRRGKLLRRIDTNSGAVTYE